MAEGQTTDIQYLIDPKNSMDFQPTEVHIPCTVYGDQSPNPLCKKNITYIVAGIVIDAGKVLMVQEAKAECHGQWYLPAGRLEPNETLEEGVCREVLEEAGLSFQIDRLICVDLRKPSWIRFTFIGHAWGGKLKALAEADKESLQAKFFPLELILGGGSKDVPLRSNDICKLINRADIIATVNSKYQQSSNVSTCLPLVYAHKRMSAAICLLHFHNPQNPLLQFVCHPSGVDDAILFPTTADLDQLCKEVSILTNSDSSLPVGEICHMRDKNFNFITRIIEGVLQTKLQSFKKNVNCTGRTFWNTSGIMGVQHDGRPKHTNDGCRLIFCVFLKQKNLICQGSTLSSLGSSSSNSESFCPTVDPPLTKDDWKWTKLSDVPHGKEFLNFIVTDQLATLM